MKIKVRKKDAVAGLAVHQGPEDWNAHVQVLLKGGELDKARTIAQRGLALWPKSIPLLNNLGLSLSFLGQQEQAIRVAQQALALDPDNLHATANLVRYFVLDGRLDLAQPHAQRLKGLAASPGATDGPRKKVEALSYIGDDQGVVALCEATPPEGDSPEDAFMQHLGAAAALRLGDEARARRWWKRALVFDKGCEAARQNLQDLDAPPGQQEGPFALTLEYWLPRSTLVALARLTGSGEAKGRVAMRKYMQEHPALARLVPILLLRGDPMARNFAVGVALLLATAPLQAALRDFCQGRYGTDELRFMVATRLCQAKVLPRTPLRLWQRGQQTEVLLISAEIYDGPTDEPMYDRSPEVQRLSLIGIERLRKGDAAGAAEVLQRAHALDPKAVEVMNNLAAAWEALGQRKRAHELVDRVYQQRPDYFFGRLAKARLLIRDGDLERAELMLRELLAAERLHISEYTALCGGQIDLALARGNGDSAQGWLEMWRKADPEHPQLKAVQTHIKRAARI